MQRRWMVSLMAAVTMLGWLSGEASAQYRYSSIAKPGAFDTLATGLNDSDWSVGIWLGRDGDESAGAFRHQKNQMIPFAVPGASFTIPADIAKASLIAGSYEVPCGGCEGGVDSSGFLYVHTANGAFVPVDPPESYFSTPTGVNDLGQVLGSANKTATDEFFQYLYDLATNTFTEIDMPDGYFAFANKLNNHGDLAGFAVIDVSGDGSMPLFHGLLRWDGVWYTFQAPGALHTVAASVNDLGQVVGWFIPADGADMKFAWLYDIHTQAWTLLHPRPASQQLQYEFTLEDIDHQGNMLGVETRLSDGFTRSVWVRPKSQVNVASRE